MSRSLEWHRDNQDDEEEEAEDFYSGNTSPAKRLAMTPNKTRYDHILVDCIIIALLISILSLKLRGDSADGIFG